jgi:SEC-C motif
MTLQIAVPESAAGTTTVGNAVNIIPEPQSPRQLADEGLVVFWRDGREPGRRQGLACILSMCPHPACACELVYVKGFVIDEQATAVSWDEDGVHLTGISPPRVTLEEEMIAIVDPDSGETRAHPDLLDAIDPALVNWLGSEMDEELLEALHRYRARAKGYPPERPRTDIELEGREKYHLMAFEELFEGTRSDDYLLAGNRYWTCIYLCPYTECDCHTLRVAFFDDKAKPGSGDTVGSVLLELGGAEGFEIVEMAAECGAPTHLIRELWALFGRRHRVAAFLRRRAAQVKALGATLCPPVAKPVRADAKPGRNEPCPCGSGVKFKKCCLGKDPSTNAR